MVKGKIKAILFDYVGVLVSSFTPEFLDILEDVSKEDRATNKEAFSKHWQKLKIGNIDDAAFWHKIKQELQLPKERMKGLIADTNNILQPTEGIFGLLDELKGKYKLFVLSNACKDWSEVPFYEHGFGGYFEEVFFSHKIGVAKPSREAFDYALGRMSVQPGQVLFVDDQKRNTDAARALGFEVCVFKSVGDVRAKLK